ncbi:RNA polymerase sigma factor FliA [Helicobacter winghamensis]|mgnify:FL=1|uniref:RNA polymerase sigma factor FliA n=1 Tax=Helicobacter winghamensis TaxID=157268 RepID=A0A2N3PK58_9HELI|nr:RNA polymerase sigma factor FliA [Helicobacter winghamensis]EEO25745.1 RNA polymerase sigma factor, FliA/WhiG family [Helicobacter winghamensis ATCC BAA-430]PKT77940.1 RNA polymerase sigma factor FliA [Helicobacter winghamensis]PKT77974.1 RNA polymerase sigma factor FliA [Helicobacter winghamensis]PKT78950.1 RNA polymerase sigma factor FliA [Helicobacter winghamensis]PKT81727.1 RNA polymerase sigma factor FliA [Helicobacter winghamensis]
MPMTSNGYQDALKRNQDSLALDYLPALKTMAFRLKERLPASVDFSDLISIGTEELIKLARKYDNSLNDSFWGYARPRVQGAMLDYLRSLDPLSRNMRTLVKRIEKEIAIYYNEHQEEPDNAYLSKLLGENEEKIKEARMASEIYSVLPIDDQLGEQKEGTLESIEKEELISVILQILEHATPNEQLVVQLYYYEELSFKEISQVLEVSEARVSQLHRAVIRRVRQYLEERGLDG